MSGSASSTATAEGVRPDLGPGPVRALWGVVGFLRPDPWRVTGSIGLLLVNIGIELSLPFILGRTITVLGRARVDGALRSTSRRR